MSSTEIAAAPAPGVRRSGAVWLLFAAALVVRCGVVLALGGFDQPIGRHDATLYDRLATHLVAGNGYRIENHYLGGQGTELVPTSVEPPAYPAFLALVYTLVGRSHAAVRLIQCALGALTVVLCFFLGRRLFGERAAWIAAILVALYPYVTIHPGQVMSETLFTFLCVAAASLLAAVSARPAPLVSIAAGVAIGLAILTKSLFVAFPPFLVAAAALFARDRRVVRAVALAALVAVLGVGLWAARNLYAHGRFVMVSTFGGIAFAQGNNAWVSRHIHLAPFGAFGRLPPADAPAIVRDTKGMSEVERERYLYRYGLAYVRAHPRATLRTMAFKALYYLVPGPLAAPGNKAVAAPWPQAIGWAVLPFVLLGGVLVARRPRPLARALPLLFIAYFFLLSLVFRYDNRYRAAAEPFLLMLAAVGADSVCSGLRRPRRDPDAGATARS